MFLNYLEYIPSGPARLEALRQCHDDPLARHFGFARTLEKLQRSYSWPTVQQYVKEYVRTYYACERDKAKRHAPYGLLSAEALSIEP